MKPNVEYKITQWVTTVYIGLSFYCLGALVIENDVNYPAWQNISDHDFPEFHQRLENLLMIPFKIPMTLFLIINLLFLRFHHRSLPVYLVWIAVINFCSLIAESMLVQLPMHTALNKLKTQKMIEDLYQSHLYYRFPAEAILCVCSFVMLFKTIDRKQIM